MIVQDDYKKLVSSLAGQNASLVAVSKLQPVEKIQRLYDWGQRDFGENYVQELLQKKNLLPPDIRWHYIGHLQSNKAKQIVGEVQLIHGIDSLKLLQEVNKQGARKGLAQDCLLQVHIAREETKFGWDESEFGQWLGNEQGLFPHVRVRGLMGMASFTSEESLIREEFSGLASLFKREAHSRQWDILSMGMSGDYPIALECGSNMVRIGSLLFGHRN